MGGNSSALNCTSKKKNKNKNGKAPGNNDIEDTDGDLTNELEKQQNNIDELRNKAGDVTKKVGHHDRELVDEKIRSREKKFTEAKARTDRLEKGYKILEDDIEGILDEVQQYLAWLKKKDEQLQMTNPEGYTVRDCEVKLHYINTICADLENRQQTLDMVSKKVDEMLVDLPRNDRDELDRTLKSLINEHQHVYAKSIAQKEKVIEAINTREVFQKGLERVNQWLQERIRRISTMDKLKLSSVDLEKEADKVKVLLMEIEKYAPNIEQIHDRITLLKTDCGPEQVQELDTKLADVQEVFEQLKVKVKDVHDKLRTNVSARKVYETDTQKLERWFKDAEMKCAVEPSIDCATEILEEQLKHYKALEQSAQLFGSFNDEVQEKGKVLLPQLYEADAMVLQQQLKSSKEKYDGTSKVITDRVKTLEEALQTRDQVGEGIEEATDWLATVQDDLRKISRTIGPTVENAEDILRQYEDVGEKITNYNPTVTQLNQAVERLRTLGQETEADEILRITSQYEMLGKQVQQQCKKCQQAVADRQHLADQMKKLDAIVTECEDSADAVIGPGVPVTDKINKLKEVSEKLQECGPAIFNMGDQAQQIAFDGTEDDAQVVNSQVEDMKARTDALKKLSDRKVKQCQSIQKNRDDFESSVNDTINWLDTKEDVLASCGSLDLDPVKVKSVLQKHQALSREALDKLDTVKIKAQVEKAHYEEMDEPIPPQLSDKLSQISTLEDSIQGAISKKEQYLSEATADRNQLETSMKQITDWIHGAEDMLDSGYDGLDYDTLNDTISEQKDYFSEASMCQDEMDQVMELTERLLPTLDMNDSETLRQSLINTSQKLADVMAASQRKQQELEKKSEEFLEYQELVEQATSDLQTLEDEWEAIQSVPLVTPEAIEKHLQDTMKFIQKVDKFRPTITELDEKSHDLDRDATERSRSSIDDLMNNVNDRWKQLIAETENKQMVLQDLEVQYEDYSQLLQGADTLLAEADAKICPTINMDDATCPELVAHMDENQELEELIETLEPKITALKKCAQQLQKTLPTAEAKVHSQDAVIAMLEKFERIQDKAKEDKQILQEEIDDREGFNEEAKQTLEWLTETKVELQQLGPSAEVSDVMEKIDRLRLSDQEISIRMEQMSSMAQLQETKYRSQGRDLPQELKEQISLMNDLQKEVNTALQQKEEELLHLGQNRQAFNAEQKLVTTWLTQATEQLQERVMDIPESIYKHEELLGEFDPFKKKLDSLRNCGGDLIKHSKEPVEKQTVQKALADVNKQWVSVQAQAGERTRQLKEVEKLAESFTAASESVEKWVSQAEAVLIAEPTWTDFDRIREQLKQHKRLLKEADQQKTKLSSLNAITKQMDTLCDTVPAMEKLTNLSHRVYDVQAKTTDKVNNLEDTNDQIEDYEKELAELKQWMEKTRTHLTMRDDTITLNEQLAMQEKLIEDIEGHKGKAMFVLQKHAEVHAAVGEDTPTNTKMASEINNLLQQAREDCDELREAVAKQEKYESEMRLLTSSISEAQAQLIGSPIQASSVDSLKQQITERNDLSQSVPSLLDPQIQELRERSSSFGSRSRPSGSSSLRSSKFDEINSSWQNLQKQLGVKERELQVALEKQERYQANVQDVTARMERVQQKLAALSPAPYKDMDQQIKEHKESEQEIESIREDIARVRERGRQIMESSDLEGYQAMQATLTMLTDKVDSLQTLADDKARQLQTAMRDRERNDIALTAYRRHVKDLEDWLEEMRVRQAATPQSTDGVSSLQQQLQENKDLQGELNLKLQQVADLAVQCDSLCESQQPEAAEKLRMQLATLQKNLGDLKLGAIEKQAPLRTAIKESEKRTREMDDYENNLKRMQQWISDTKKLATSAPPSGEMVYTPAKKQELQQQLESDLSQHRRLVHQLSSEVKTREMQPPSRDTITSLTLREEDIQPRWETLSQKLTQKKQNLEDIINKTAELVGPGKYGRRYGPDSSSQLQDVRGHLSALTDFWKQLQVQVDDKQVRLDQVLAFQQRYQDALDNVSGWLDLAEQKIFAPDSSMNSREKVKENEDLQREIKSLQGEILSMGRQAQELLSVTNSDSHQLIRQSLGNLNDRVQILEGQARDQGDKLRTADRHYRQYQEEVRNLEDKLEETRALMTSPSASAPLSLLVNNMQDVISLEQKIEAQLKKCEAQLEALKKRQAELSALDPEMISPYEMDALQSNYMDLQRKVMEKKASLQQSVSVQEQYEKLLQDYAEFLETADNKLKTEAISARDLDHLKSQLNSHKDFFSDLEVHRAMLDSLVAQCDKATKQKHLPQHTKLSNLTYVLQDKASLHGQRLERLVSQWSEMEDKFNQLQRFLDDIDQQIPKPISNDDTLSAIQTKINTYHRLQRELNDEKPTVFQVVDKGRQILHSINCPALEQLVTELGEKWVDLNTDLSHELKRTQSLGEQLHVFEAESAVIRSWLTAARAKLSGIKQLSSTDLRSIATVRSKIDKILEFRKEVENQQGLKDKVISIGNQLLENKVYQTHNLNDSLQFFQKEWAQLQHDINKAEEYLHQAQMDLMPSRQALGELSAWLTEIEEALFDDRNKPMKNVADMEVLLKKYKSYKIDLSSKQLTVDFVNQDVLQQKDDEIPVPAEQNEFSERLLVLNGRWKEVSGHVNDRLKALEAIHCKWDEFEKAMCRLIGWFKDQEDKIKRYHLIGHEVSVRQTLKDVKSMKQALKNKQMDINLVKEVGQTLVTLSEDAPGCQASIQASMEVLFSKQRQLNNQISKIQKLLEDVLSQWDCYHSELQVMTSTLTETEYCLQRYNLIGGDIATLKIQAEKLEGLMSTMEQNKARQEKFSTLASRLSQTCESPVKQEIQKTQADIQSRWHSVFSELKSRTEKFRECLQLWLNYENGYNKAKMWLDGKEKLCEELLYGKDDINKRDDNLALCKSLQEELDSFQTELSSLYRAGDEVTRDMDPTSIVSITSKLSGLEQRVITLRQKLGKHIQNLQGDLSHQRRFAEAFNAVNAFLSQAQRILGMEDPNKAADERVLRDRLDHLKELSSQFSDNLQKLDALNDLGYRLALNETAAAELQDLNHKWHEMYSDTKERCKTLQGILLIQQDFTEKCDLWMTFLAQTENDLSTEIAGNLIDLMDQQRKCEKFESEMYSRQQILHAIISDGQIMMKEGDISNKEEFQQKLHLLAEQWQSVMRRANQRKAIIESTIKQWQAFNESAEKLREWLKEKEEGLDVFNFGTTSLQKVKSLVEKAKNHQNEFKLQEDIFRSMNNQGKQLLQRADDKAQEEIRISMAQIQQHWHQLFVKLDEQRESLESVLRQWQECEDDIEEILTWLKDTRKTLNGKLPAAYEDLQADMHRCKDIEAAFVNAEPKRQALMSKEKALGKVIEPEDLNILHQRIRLLNKQWDELKNQAILRSQRIDDDMFRWSKFSKKFKQLCDWIDQMEVKVIASRDLHIEDLLTKMQKDYHEEMAEKEKAKNALVLQGQSLMKASSDVRSSDIDQKCARLEDKWQHLKAIINFRQRKLQETLLAVQQLDISMSNLRKWLSDMEQDLCAPVSYQECTRKEIQHKLQHQTELQQDIERHSPGVGSVLNLCEVLLHDSDACPTDVEFNGLQTAMRNLERRWRSICQMAPQQTTKIDETWDHWQALMEDCRVFTEWLKIMEEDVLDTSTDQANVSTSSKEEFTRCETNQRRLHENLNKLENINKKYRRLAREGRTDTAGTLKTMMQDANDRWDRLQGQVSGTLRQLRKSSSLKEDFKRSKESLMSWLTEIDVQLTNVDHLSSMDVPAKLRELKRIQEETESQATKFAYVEEVAGYVIQKGDSMDAMSVQLELEEYHQYKRQVLDRVALTKARLERLASQGANDDLDRLEADLYADSPDSPYTQDWDMHELEAYLDASPPESPPEKRRALLRARARARSRSRSRSPVRKTPLTSSPSPSLNSSRSRSPTRYRGKSPRRVVQDVVSRARSPTREERWSQLKGDLSRRGKEDKVNEILQKLVDALMDADNKLHIAEREVHSRTPTGPDVEQKSANYLQSMSNSEKSVDDVRRIDRLLKAETGLRTITSADAQVRSIVERWEVLQASAIQKDFRLGQHRQDWTQFKHDLDNMLSWLDEAEALQHTHKPLPGEITRLDTIIRQHKDFLVQLEAKKTRVISINLTSRELIDITTDEGRLLKERLKIMNKRWDAICGQATRLQQELQVALMQCQEFHHTIHDLLLWLENTETKIQQSEPVNIGPDSAAVWSRLRKLRDIKFDLEKNQPRVMSLKDTADQLLISTDSPEMSNAKDKMHIIANRLRSLLRLCSSYITSLESRLDAASASASSRNSSLDFSGSPGSSEPGSPRGGNRTSTPRYSPFRPGSSSSVRTRPRSPFAISRQLNQST